MAEPRPPVCVVGAGTMGRGIAQVAVGHGHLVNLVDPDERQLDAAVDEILNRLGRKDPAARQGASERLAASPTIARTDAHPGTVLVEAVVEDLSVKQAVLSAALEHLGADCILATNTSSLSITEIAATVADPSRVVGMHFFNPVPVMKLVEVVTGLQTDPDVAAAVEHLAISWGKQVARVKSTPGFIVNRVARAFYGEALKLVEEGATTPEVIDELMRSAGQFRMGPFELMDLIGVEVNLAVTTTVWQAYNFDPRFAPSRIQQELVASGRLGRKSGSGFYRYGDGIERERPEATPPGTGAPPRVRLHGHSNQLETLLARARIAYEQLPSEDGADWVELVGVGWGVISRGRTAQQEALMRGVPVVVLDRCLEPERASALAVAASNDAIADVWLAILDRAGVRGYRIEDAPGLVLCRILVMIANEAWEAVHHGVAARADIDAAMVYGTNYPVGPFAWCDEWGAANVLEVLDQLWSEYRDPRYRASQRLRAVARAATP